MATLVEKIRSVVQSIAAELNKKLDISAANTTYAKEAELGTLAKKDLVKPEDCDPEILAGIVGPQGPQGFGVVTVTSRAMTLAQWQAYGITGTETKWVVANPSAFQVGETGIINGTITDLNNLGVFLIGSITAIGSGDVTIKCGALIYGSQGAPGPQGPTGPQGPAGDPGESGGYLPIGFEYIQNNPNVYAGSLPLTGGEYSRTTYSALWAWVQTQTDYLLSETDWQAKKTADVSVPYYSTGDGSTTFRVPNLTVRARVIAFNTVSEEGGVTLDQLRAGIQEAEDALDESKTYLEGLSSSVVKTVNGNSPDPNGNITPAQTGCLPTAGGTVSGATTFGSTTQFNNIMKRNFGASYGTVHTVLQAQSGTSTHTIIYVSEPNGTDTYGKVVSFGGSGVTIIGAGESYKAAIDELKASTAENMYVTADSTVYLYSNANTYANKKIATFNTSGVFQAPTIQSTSDIRKKKCISALEDCLDKVDQINPYTYSLDGDDTGFRAGVIAQEVKEVLPEAVRKDEEGFYAMDYHGFTALLLGAIKELKTEVEGLKYGNHN